MSEYEQVIDEIVKHGVVVKVNKIVDDNYIPYERKYVGCVVELDFSEHDKVFEDKIADLQQRIAELESKETETVSEIDTSTPIDCTNSLINHLTLLEASLIMPERYVRTFDIDELEQIAEHLLVYCKHNKESE